MSKIQQVVGFLGKANKRPRVPQFLVLLVD